GESGYGELRAIEPRMSLQQRRRGWERNAATEFLDEGFRRSCVLGGFGLEFLQDTGVIFSDAVAESLQTFLAAGLHSSKLVSLAFLHRLHLFSSFGDELYQDAVGRPYRLNATFEVT